MGRDVELDRLPGVLAGRHFRGFVVSGPAGVGKTRLAEECLDRAVATGFQGVRATASSAAGVVPLGAIGHLLPAGLDLSDPAAAFASLGLALARRKRRLVIMVDDLHLLDDTSARLLQQLLGTQAIRLIATIRSGEPVSDAVDELQNADAVQRVELGALDEATVEALLERILGGRVGHRTVRELFTASGGNVLYLKELVEGALASGALTDGEVWELTARSLAGTPRLSELISARLAAAGQEGNQVLELLALCGSVGRVDAESVASSDTLKALEDAGLVQEASDGKRVAVGLAHPLYGEVVRSSLPALRRRAILLAQAARVHARGARRRDDTLHIATWQLAATGTADPALLTQAAALARHAHDYRQAVVLIEAIPEASRTVPVQLMHGEALFELGRQEEAVELLARVDATVRSEWEKLAVTVLRTIILYWGCGRSKDALAVIDTAKTHVTSPDGQRVLRVLEGSVCAVSGQPTRALHLFEELDEDIQQAPNINVWLAGMMMKGAALAGVGRMAEALEWAEHAYSTHQRIDDQAQLPHPGTQLNSVVIALAQAGRLGDAREIGERTFNEFVAAKAPLPQIWMAWHLARVEWMAGHPASARKWYAESLAVARRINQLLVVRSALSGLAACAAHLGDLDAADRALADLSKYPRGFDIGEEVLGTVWTLAARGNLTQAREELKEAALAAQAGDHRFAEVLLLTDMARLGGARDVGRLNELAQVCDGPLPSLHAEFAAALAADSPQRLWQVSEAFERLGADLLAAEAATASLTASRRQGNRAHQTPAATHRTEVLTARCQGARTPLLATTEATAPLTAREREIAFLAAGGASSKDIATALGLSARTVDNHLARAYSKLGVTTRRDLATILAGARE
ncbi:LuxR C-terminal-related transcriptional regulator [Streptomyces sp. NPDC058661]